jgi:hypothetical protein
MANSPSGFKSCSNGHWYKQDLSSCPYCPTNATVGGDSTSMDFDKTQMGKTGTFGPSNTSDSTIGVGATKTQTVSGGNEPRDFERTFIGGVERTEIPGSKGDGPVAEPRKTRKIVGWLVSFTLDPMGVDYRVYEGNNSIGRDAACNITITRDTTMSSKHANILYRETQGFFLKDDMSANGTFINGEELEIGKAYHLKDGDEVRMAQTIFLFKSCAK